VLFRSQKTIRENLEELHLIAKALIEYETLTGDEIIGLLEGKDPVTSLVNRTFQPAYKNDIWPAFEL